MGWIEDSAEEFRKLPPAGKAVVGVAALGAAILGYVAYRTNAANSAAVQAANSTSGAFPGGVGVTTVTDPAGGTWTIPPNPPSAPSGGIMPFRQANGTYTTIPDSALTDPLRLMPLMTGTAGQYRITATGSPIISGYTPA